MLPEEIKKAYRVVAMQCHPDKGTVGGLAFYSKAQNGHTPHTTTPHIRLTSFVKVNSFNRARGFGVRRANQGLVMILDGSG